MQGLDDMTSAWNVTMYNINLIGEQSTCFFVGLI